MLCSLLVTLLDWELTVPEFEGCGGAGMAADAPLVLNILATGGLRRWNGVRSLLASSLGEMGDPCLCRGLESLFYKIGIGLVRYQIWHSYVTFQATVCMHSRFYHTFIISENNSILIFSIIHKQTAKFAQSNEFNSVIAADFWQFTRSIISMVYPYWSNYNTNNIPTTQQARECIWYSYTACNKHTQCRSIFILRWTRKCNV